MRPLVLAVALVSFADGTRAQERVDPRADMDALGSALEQAVQKVARPGAWAALQAGTWRCYLLQGYGAMFVLSPRVVPVRARLARAPQEVQLSRAITEAMRGLEESLKQADSDALRRQIEAAIESLRQTQARLTETEQAAEGSSHDAVRLRTMQRAHERELRRQMDEMQRQMEAFRREAERAREEAEREIAARLAITPPPMPREAPLAPVAEPAPPAPVAVPAPPAEPAIPSEIAPLPPLPPPAAPPWESLWLDREEPAAKSGERLAQEVRSAVTATLQERGADLHGLRPEDFVVVAVDFVSRAALASSRPQKTLLVRVRKRALDDVRAGRLTEAGFRKRVEYLDY
ncbi:MAG TPA: hypothetical protein VGL15_06960 [Vicinamibacteria bacterium]|jgi:hypothetical protein